MYVERIAGHKIFDCAYPVIVIKRVAQDANFKVIFWTDLCLTHIHITIDIKISEQICMEHEYLWLGIFASKGTD